LRTLSISQLLTYGGNLWQSRGKRHLLITGSTDVLLLVTALATGILTARLLGPEGRGELAIVIIWPSVIAAVGSLGVREALVYEQARTIHSRAVLTGAAILLAGLQSSVLVLLGWLLIPFLTQSQSDEIAHLTQQFLLFIFLNYISLYLGALLHGRLQIALYNVKRFSVKGFYIVGLMALWASSAVTVRNTAYALLIANAAAAVLAVIFILKDDGVSFQFRSPLLKDIFAYGLKSHVGSISHMFNERLDQMVLALLLSPIELGWYVVAVSAANITKIAASPFAQMIFPRIAGQNQTTQRHLLQAYSRFALLATGTLVLLLFMTLPILIPFVYGNEFSPSSQPAQILVLASIFLGVGYVWRQAFSGMGQPAVTSQAELLSLVVTAVGIYVFVPIYGILGAAWVSFVAYGVTMLFLGVRLRFFFGIPWRGLFGV
jgi:enterobacterial common antigen flippase